jgi:hypothetical protein
MKKDTKLNTTESLNTKQSSLIVIDLTTIMVFKETNLAWLKSNTWIS